MMLIAQVKWKIREDLGGEARENAIDLLLGSWRQNGQITGREQRFAEAGSYLLAFVQLPASDALDRRYDNKYVGLGKRALKEAGLSLPKIILFGEEESHDHYPSCYILYTDYLTTSSPLRCGECFAPFPMYTIPPTYDNTEYFNVMAWESDYQACDKLQMGCATGERFALREMSDVNSSLSKRGRKLCQEIERLTGRPTYYPLYRFLWKTTATKERERRCPGCGGEWLLSEAWHLFDFRCDHCRLVSALSPV